MIRALATLLVLMNISPAKADGSLIVAEGSVLRTASLPNKVYEQRAIADALQSVVQSGAQSLESFSLVENGQILFDQVSAQSDVVIGGYRVVSLNSEGSTVSARLEVLLLPRGDSKRSATCRQPVGLGLELIWDGITYKKSMPFWLSLDDATLIHKAKAALQNDSKFNLQAKSTKIQQPKLAYSLYEPAITATPEQAKFKIHLGIEVDVKNASNLLNTSKTLEIHAKATLTKNGRTYSQSSLKDEYVIEKRSWILNSSASARNRQQEIGELLAELSKDATLQAMQTLACQNFSGSIAHRNGELEIDYGFRDGLIADDIFVARAAGAQRHYFTVKDLSDNKTTLHILSQGQTKQKFDGLSIKLLERFQ